MPAKDFASKKWKALRDKVIERDDVRCVVCGHTRKLSCHHIKPRREGGKDTLRNLITLCTTCHDQAEEGGWAWIQENRGKKTPIKFNIKKPEDIPLGLNEHLRFSKSLGKWQVWGRDRLGVYANDVTDISDEKGP